MNFCDNVFVEMDDHSFSSVFEGDIGFIRHVVGTFEEANGSMVSEKEQYWQESGSSKRSFLQEKENSRERTGNPDEDFAEKQGKLSREKMDNSYEEDSDEDDSDEDDSDIETDLECDEDLDKVSITHSPKGIRSLEAVYTQACKELKINACSPFLRQIRDDEIDISHYNIGPLGMNAVAKTMMQNTTTTLLNVHDNGIEAAGAKVMAEMLFDNCFITVLDLSMNFIGEEGIASMARMLENNKYILEVSIASTRLNDHSCECIAEAMTKNSTLRTFDLSSNEIGEEGAIEIARGIRGNTGLTFLDLQSNCIRSHGAVAIANSLTANCTLKTLDISVNGFADNGARAVGKALAVNSTLREIDLSKNRIAFDGAWALGIGLEENVGLKVLKIGGNPFQSRGATSIIDSLMSTKKTKIEEIYFYDITIQDDFEKLLPQLLEQHEGIQVQFGVILKGKEHRKRGREQKDLVGRILDFVELRGIRIVDFFRAMDKTSRLMITKDELIKGLRTAGIPMRKSQVDNLFSVLDIDGDGFAQYREFVKIIKERLHNEFATTRSNYQWNH